MEQTRKNLHRSEDPVIDLDLAVWGGRYECSATSRATTGLGCTPSWTLSPIGNPSLGLSDQPSMTNVGAMSTRQHDHHPGTTRR